MGKLKLISVVLALMITAACTEKKPVVNKAEEIARIQAVLEKYVIAKEDQNFSLIEEVWAGNEDVYLLGTDSDEKFIGWEQIKDAITEQFSEFQQTYISTVEQSIKLNETGNTAWFVEVLSYNFVHEGKAKQFEGIRFTGVLQKHGDVWKLVQGHMSIPVEKGTEQAGN